MQDEKCAICRTSFPDMGAAHADHDHVTQAKRELLCRGCNQLIGCAKEDPDILTAAAAYLERHNAQPK